MNLLPRTDLPRGLRNNNPGNLVKTSIPWKGKITPGADSTFEQFESVEYGLRALFLDVLNDIKDGQNTIRKLIYEFAPPHENATEAYIAAVSGWTGLGPDEPIEGMADIVDVVKGIVRHENGPPYVVIPESSYMQALNMIGAEPITEGEGKAGLGVLAGILAMFLLS